MTAKCNHCGLEMPYNAGWYYHIKECQAKIIIAKLKTARAKHAEDTEAIRELELQLAIARDVGD